MKQLKLKTIIVGLVLITFSSIASGKDIEISNIWAREAHASHHGHSAVYLDIANNSNDNDVLLNASTPIAGDTQIHNTVIKDSISSMIHLSELEIPAKSSVVFKPKSLHIMLMGLKHDIKVGDSFPMEFIFKKAGKIIATVTVKKPAA
jgi:copper(I)-binding protein